MNDRNCKGKFFFFSYRRCRFLLSARGFVGSVGSVWELWGWRDVKKNLKCWNEKGQIGLYGSNIDTMSSRMLEWWRQIFISS